MITSEQFQALMTKLDTIDQKFTKFDEFSGQFSEFMQALEAAGQEKEGDQEEEEEEEEEQPPIKSESEINSSVTSFPSASGNQVERTFKQDLLELASSNPYAAAQKL